MKEINILLIAFILLALFFGGYFVYTTLFVPHVDVDTVKLADDYKSELGELRTKYRIQAELFARANQYLKNSIKERDREIREDRQIIRSLEDRATELQIETRKSIDKTGDITETIHRIETATDDIGSYFQFLKFEIRRIQEEHGKEDYPSPN